MENWASETRSNEVCWDRVINAWLDGKGQDLYSQTWEGFYEMLKDVELGGHVPALKEAVASLGMSCIQMCVSFKLYVLFMYRI